MEYDSCDESKEAPFYAVKYTDGDREDLNEEELGFACELCLQIELDAEDNVALESGTDEDESYHSSVSKGTSFIEHAAN